MTSSKVLEDKTFCVLVGAAGQSDVLTGQGNKSAIDVFLIFL